MECRTILLRRLRSNPRLRAAISMLAARRFTSHSKGPGSVSSKSFTSNTRSRSGEAKPPKFDQVRVAAELHVQRGARRRREVGGEDVGRTAVERERRRGHATVADGHQLGHPRDLLGGEQRQRVGPVRLRGPLAVAGPRHVGARRLPQRHALGHARVLDPGQGCSLVRCRRRHHVLLAPSPSAPVRHAAAEPEWCQGMVEDPDSAPASILPVTRHVAALR